MTATIVYGGTSSFVENAQADRDGLWVTLEDLQKLTGWVLKPEGVCRGEVCIPLTPGRESESVSGSRGFNLVTLAGHLGETVVHSDDLSAWVFSEPASKLGGRLRSLQAPDFELPDLDGRPHRLSDYIGNKVFLFAWASW